MKKTTLLTHLSYDKKGHPFIGSAMPLSTTKMPKGRMTGVFGRQAGLKASTFWWKKMEAMYNKPLSKVELYLDDTGKSSINQSVEDIGEFDVLNILLAQTPLTDQLNVWVKDYSSVEKLYLGDRDFFRRIVKNPEIINKLFDVPELARVKAIVWPAIDPANNTAYIKMITLRSMDDVTGMRIFNFDGDQKTVPYKLDGDIG